MLIMHQLARILLYMNALDPNDFVFGNAALGVRLYGQLPLTHDGMVQLTDLIPLRQIGIKVVLAVEPRIFVDLRFDRHAGAHGLPDALAIGHRQHPGHRRIDERHLRIGLRAERGVRAAEQLGRAGDLCVNLKADHDLPFARCALDAVVTHIVSRTNYK